MALTRGAYRFQEDSAGTRVFWISFSSDYTNSLTSAIMLTNKTSSWFGGQNRIVNPTDLVKFRVQNTNRSCGSSCVLPSHDCCSGTKLFLFSPTFLLTCPVGPTSAGRMTPPPSSLCGTGSRWYRSNKRLLKKKLLCDWTKPELKWVQTQN